MKDSIKTANIQCVEADYAGSDTSDTPSSARASAGAGSDVMHLIFDDIAPVVTEFLTRHPEIWWIDKHYVWNVHPRVSVSLLHF